MQTDYYGKEDEGLASPVAATLGNKSNLWLWGLGQILLITLVDMEEDTSF
jgi:hypothetical protein